MKRGRRGGKKRGHELLPDLAAPAETVPRRLRVENDVHRELSIALSGMSDRRLAMVTVTRVQMTEDLRFVKVFTRPSSLPGAAVPVDRMLEALQVARGRLRRHLATTLGLRFTPELRFYFDDGPDAARRVDALLDEIASERASQASDLPDEELVDEPSDRSDRPPTVESSDQD